jgi:hypothetical protein
MQVRPDRIARIGALFVILATAVPPTSVRAQEPRSVDSGRAAQSVSAARLTVRDWPSLVSPEQMGPRAGTREALQPAGRLPRSRSQNRPRTYNAAQRIAITAGMGFAGFLAGGYIGAKIEGDCACDDPGLQGIIIGAPIGAAAGAIFGAWLTR